MRISAYIIRAVLLGKPLSRKNRAIAAAVQVSRNGCGADRRAFHFILHAITARPDEMSAVAAAAKEWFATAELPPLAAAQANRNTLV
jgi:hypothetical protein